MPKSQYVDPGKAFEEALLYGSLVNMKVENMREQFKEKLDSAPKEVINKKYKPIFHNMIGEEKLLKREKLYNFYKNNQKPNYQY